MLCCVVFVYRYVFVWVYIYEWMLHPNSWVCLGVPDYDFICGAVFLAASAEGGGLFPIHPLLYHLKSDYYYILAGMCGLSGSGELGTCACSECPGIVH